VNVTVFGASGDIGRHVVEELLDRRHRVTAMVRGRDRLPADLAGRLRVVEGELPDERAIDEAVRGAGAVIWAVGPTSNTADQPPLFEAAAEALVVAMNRHRVRRLIALSGAGVTMPGERKPIAGRVMSRLVALVVRHVVAAKDREREIFTSSGLDWTLVRPPRVVGGEARGRPILSERLRSPRVTQGDVALAMVTLLGPAGKALIRRAPYVS
jgi:putative NADH-flavin reductase